MHVCVWAILLKSESNFASLLSISEKAKALNPDH